MIKNSIRNKGKVYNNPWVITIGGGVIVYAICAVLTSIVMKVDILAAVGKVFKVGVHAVVSVLSYGVPVWLIVSALVVMLLAVHIILHFEASMRRDDDGPAWLNYRQESYQRWFFVWDYRKVAGEYTIVGLRPVCSKCKCELSERSMFLECSNCGSKFALLNRETVPDLGKIITHRIKTGEYADHEVF